MMQTLAPRTIHRVATAPAAAVRAVQPRAVVARAAERVQASSMKVSSPHDPAEREATTMARDVMRMSLPASTSTPAHAEPTRGGAFRRLSPDALQANRFESPYVARFRSAGLFAPVAGIQCRAEGTPVVSADVAAEIRGSMDGGSPLPMKVRQFMEPRFRADFSQVRIHTDEKAARLSRQLNAQAFTVGRSVFFGRGQFQPESTEGRELIAHELTHTIQQGAAVQRREEPTVTQAAPPMVQRLGLGDALDYIADKANLIPGFRMFTIILGVNPVNMAKVERSAANILRALIEVIPGGALITQAMENHGVFDRIGRWVEQQIQTLGMVGGAIKQALTQFLDSLSWRDIFNLGGVWERAKRIFTEPIDRIINFGKGLVTGIIGFIKDAILMPLARLAQGTRGYDLLCAVLGKDPITGVPVPQTADKLIGGFMKLIGQEEIWENIKRANAVARAFAWFKATIAGLVALVSQLPTTFVNTLKSLEILDIVLVPRAFIKVAGVFVNFVGGFISWAGNAVWNLLEIVFDVVSPGAWGYIKRTGSALRSILRNPLPFVGNLVRAAKLGFTRFADNFTTHLKAGLIDWLTGSLPGVYIPKSFALVELVKFVFSVLGLTWQNVRQKLVRLLGEPVVTAMETGFDIVVTLVRDGPAAAWDKIKEHLANLQDMVVGGIIDMVVSLVVTKAVPKLISLFIPGAGFITAIIAIYDTIMVFVNKISKIIQVVTGFINSITAIAAGAIDSAAAKVESTLAGLLSLAISFLAGFVGLGKVSDKVMAVINRIRAAIDKALDKLVDWIANMARRLWGGVRSAAQGALQWWRERKAFRTAGGESHEVFYRGDERNAVPMVASNDPQPIAYRLSEFSRQSKEPTATAAQKGAAGLITATDTALKRNPADPVIVTNIKRLFDIFEEPAPKGATKLEEKTSSLGGDSVGVHMTIDWMDATFPTKHPGSPPKSGAQEKLMGKLVTDPTERSADKFIRGHLLNENLGGVGKAENMFPITGNANSQHLHSTESKVKRWLERKPKRWVRYEVKVDGISSKLNARSIDNNYVNCTFNCRAVLKDAAGKEEESFVSAINSTYQTKGKAAVFDT